MSPAAGKKARAGDTVTIVVASEPTTATVPDVVGRTEANATNQLEDKGFTVKTAQEAVADQASDGKVISTDPAAGESHDKGSQVTIVIGTYTAPTSPQTTSPTDGTTP